MPDLWVPDTAPTGDWSRDHVVDPSVGKSMAAIARQFEGRTLYHTSILAPHDPTISRRSEGPWDGSFTLPVASDPRPYCPLTVLGPLWFPLIDGKPAHFMGRVDTPFYSMEGFDAARWGRYWVIGAIGAAQQFRVLTQSNATWSADVADVPRGHWTFSLVTYRTVDDETNDTNRIVIGATWRDVERPGDVRDWYNDYPYLAKPATFVGVTQHRAAQVTISGTLMPFTPRAGRTYIVLATDETDVEYAWAHWDVAASTGWGFSLATDNLIFGRLALRLIECRDDRPVAVVGRVWAEEFSDRESAHPDLRIEYRSCTDTLPVQATALAPAFLDGSWLVTLVPPGIGRVSLVDCNTHRIFGEYTMPSGLLRSYNVPAVAAGQVTAEVYFDAFNDTCFLYDAAVVLIGFLQTGDEVRARRLLDGIIATQFDDGSFPFACPQFALGAGIRFFRTGAVAWVIYALLLCDQPKYRAWFPVRPTDAIIRSITYCLGFMNSAGLMTGGLGRYVDGVLDPDYLIPWWSCEHNLDLWWCFDLAATLYDREDWREVADGIKAALTDPAIGWAPDGIFWQGGGHDGDPAHNDGSHALDMHTWGGVALAQWGRLADTQHALDRADRLYYVVDQETGLEGFTTFIAEDGYPAATNKSPWYEGSYGDVIAWRSVDPVKAGQYMATFALGQRDDGLYPYVVQPDPANEIHTFPSVIGPAWQVLAYAGPGTPLDQVFWQRLPGGEDLPWAGDDPPPPGSWTPS